MISLSQITELLGWASLLNLGFLTVATILIIAMRGTASRLHSRLFGIPEDEVVLMYFKYLAHYKTLTLVFFLAPYCALKLMGE